MASVSTVPVPILPQLKLKHLLVTTDFSDCSSHALRQAAAVARLHGADLLILHVLPPVPDGYSSFAPMSWDHESVRAAAERDIETQIAKESVFGIPYEARIETGGMNSVLKRMVHEREISMIVAGTHGRSGFKKLFLGSMAEEIFRSADCPVMTVGPDVSSSMLTHGRFNSIVFATQLSPGSCAALPFAIGLAHESQAKLMLLHVVEQGAMSASYLREQLITDTKRRLRQMMAAYDCARVDWDVRVVVGYAVEEILRYVSRNGADLIVMGVHKGGNFGARTSAHLPWTIASSVACHAPCPVLTVRG